MMEGADAKVQKIRTDLDQHRFDRQLHPQLDK
jgi:hypothetical protein